MTDAIRNTQSGKSDKSEIQSAINPELPIQTADGNEVIIIDVLPRGRYNIIGVINYGGGHCKFLKWDKFGVPKADETQVHEDARIENVPGFESATVHLNVYEDENSGYTTGYGYASEEVAKKYANADRPLTPIARVETTLIFSQ